MEITEAYCRSVARAFLEHAVLPDDEPDAYYDVQGMIEELAKARKSGTAPEDYLSTGGDITQFLTRFRIEDGAEPEHIGWVAVIDSANLEHHPYTLELRRRPTVLGNADTAESMEMFLRATLIFPDHTSIVIEPIYG